MATIKIEITGGLLVHNVKHWSSYLLLITFSLVTILCNPCGLALHNLHHPGDQEIYYFKGNFKFKIYFRFYICRLTPFGFQYICLFCLQVQSRLQIYKQNAEAILSTYMDLLNKVFPYSSRAKNCIFHFRFHHEVKCVSNTFNCFITF